MAPTTKTRWQLGAGGIVALVFVALELAAMLVLALLWIPSFSHMYRDLGQAALPGFTKLILRGRWLQPAMVATAAIAFTALAAPLRVRVRGSILGVVAIVGAIVIGAAIWGVYMPIFELADSIKD